MQEEKQINSNIYLSMKRALNFHIYHGDGFCFLHGTLSKSIYFTLGEYSVM